MTEITVYNTLSRQKEKFEPLDPNNVRMYVCGPTVYDYAHLGNARPIVVFDTLYRLLKKHFPKVTYARNITDVEDKILARAKERNISIKELTTTTAQIFHDDIAHLNTLPPDIEPLATEYIGQMIALIDKLVVAGNAYEKDGHVLFNVPSMPDYGRLSRRSRDELIAGARVEVAPYKKDPADFILWKPAKDDEEGWESPWGRGRPGWHIECSAMAADAFGPTFDIHGGGLDLIFPHHENEIAQSSCAHGGQSPAKYWMHNGFLIVNGEKMSKSLGNFFTIHELLDKTPGEALRLTLLSSHYRQPCDFTKKGLAQNKAILDKWYKALATVKDLNVTPEVPENVDAALCDDLNTPMAISHMHEIVGELNRTTNDDEKAKLKSALLGAGQALGLLYQDAETWLKGNATSDGPSEDDIEKAIAARIDAKKNKDFAESDLIRNELASKGVILEDSPQGTTWRRA